MFADVILPLPLNGRFTYSIPQELRNKVMVGCRATVPFGPKKVYTAIVMKVHDEEPQGFTVRSIIDVPDSHPIVNANQLKMWQWISFYYACPLGEVYNAALPAKLKPKDENATRKPKRKRNTICVSEDDSQTYGAHTLSDIQQQAKDEIEQSFKTKNITLLHGVTASGKTEIYIHLIKECIEQGKQVLYLLPEIALTTQITNRLAHVFGNSMGVYHSRFTDKQRADVYNRQLSDEPYSLILGARSAIFLPFSNLGLVIIDEEHETSYKQQDPAPRYHARTCAIMLGREYGAKVLLGTATPSIESYHLAMEGKYGYVRLTQRHRGIQLPDIEVVDVKRLRKQKRMKGVLSPVLIDELRQVLENGEQAILFQNRRGFSSFIECKTCGWVPRCEHCDVSLTFHKASGRLICHYCGKAYLMPVACPCCEGKEFVEVGSGTERVEEEIHELFPEARVMRMDLDTTRAKNAYDNIINDFAAHKSDILIGTQMVSKGLDFDNVRIVGILDADTMLNQPDFRSHERTYHMLSQVAGRAGRKGKQGKVILQTRSADSNTIKQIVHNDYDGMYLQQLDERRLFHYPPFYRVIYVYLRHKDDKLLDSLATSMATMLRQTFGERVLGPDSPMVSRVQSMHIRKIIIKIENTASAAKVREALQQYQQQILALSSANGLNIYYDVDPQ